MGRKSIYKCYIKNEIFVIKNLFRILTWSLISLSALAFLSVQFQFIFSDTYTLSLTSQGVITYFSKYEGYYYLFAGTIATTVGLVAMLSLAHRITQDKYYDWKQILDYRLSDIGRSNVSFESVFKNIRFKLFRDLYRINFVIKSAVQLEEFFNKYFKGSIVFFEESDDRYEFTGFYPDEKFLFSYINFRYVFISCLDEYDEKYTFDNIDCDLRKMYNQELDKTVNLDLFNIGMSKYRTYRYSQSMNQENQ